MPRKTRFNDINTTYSITVTGLDELNIFEHMVDRAKFIELMEKYAFTYHMNVYCYDFKINSVDFDIHDSKGKLSKFMKCVEGTYSQHYFNKKYNRSGTIYKDRFKSRIIKNYVYNNIVKNIIDEKQPLNDGNLVNFDIDSSIVFDMVKEYFKLDEAKFLFNKNSTYTENELNAISILTFSLRSFCGCIHRKISRLLKGVNESMSSTLSLNGLRLIMENKYKDFYFKLLMVIYKDEKNCVYV